MTNTHELLAEPFPPEVERTLTKSGTRLTYIPVSEVIARMNRVLGLGNWDMTVDKVERDKHDPDFVIAHVRVRAVIDGREVVKDGVGGQTIKRTKKGDIVDLGDEFKGAVSDAFKKACQMLGIGLYLARTDDALYAEEAYYSEEKQAAPAPRCDQETWETFVSHLNTCGDGEMAAFKEWWNQSFPGRGRPSQENSDTNDILAAIEEMVRITLGAEQVDG